MNCSEVKRSRGSPFCDTPSLKIVEQFQNNVFGPPGSITLKQVWLSFGHHCMGSGTLPSSLDQSKMDWDQGENCSEVRQIKYSNCIITGNADWKGVLKIVPTKKSCSRKFTITLCLGVTAEKPQQLSPCRPALPDFSNHLCPATMSWAPTSWPDSAHRGSQPWRRHARTVTTVTRSDFTRNTLSLSQKKKIQTLMVHNMDCSWETNKTITCLLSPIRAFTLIKKLSKTHRLTFNVILLQEPQRK